MGIRNDVSNGSSHAHAPFRCRWTADSRADSLHAPVSLAASPVRKWSRDSAMDVIGDFWQRDRQGLGCPHGGLTSETTSGPPLDYPRETGRRIYAHECLSHECLSRVQRDDQRRRSRWGLRAAAGVSTFGDDEVEVVGDSMKGVEEGIASSSVVGRSESGDGASGRLRCATGSRWKTRWSALERLRTRLPPL